MSESHDAAHMDVPQAHESDDSRNNIAGGRQAEVAPMEATPTQYAIIMDSEAKPTQYAVNMEAHDQVVSELEAHRTGDCTGEHRTDERSAPLASTADDPRVRTKSGSCPLCYGAQ